jgi:hypothetical protein
MLNQQPLRVSDSLDRMVSSCQTFIFPFSFIKSASNPEPYTIQWSKHYLRAAQILLKVPKWIVELRLLSRANPA